MKPVVDGLVQKYAGKYDIKLMDLSNGDAAASHLADSYGVEYVPTFVFLNADGSLADKIVGAVPVAQLEAELAKLQ